MHWDKLRHTSGQKIISLLGAKQEEARMREMQRDLRGMCGGEVRGGV